jgi:hypothetical protein
MQPYDIKANGKIIVTSINNPTGGAGVKNTWRISCGSGAGTTVLGVVAATPTNFPVALNPTLDNEVLVTEVFFTYTPVFKTIIYQGSTLSATAYTRPRNHNLMTSPDTPAGSFKCP